MDNKVFSDEMAKRENEISEMIRKDNDCSTFFSWDFKSLYPDSGMKIEVTVHTFNPRHNTRFLLLKESQETCDNSNAGLQQLQFSIIDEVKQFLLIKENTNYNYLVEWNQKDTLFESVKRSYFNGQTVDAVLEKLYNENNRENFVIYKIEMIAES